MDNCICNEVELPVCEEKIESKGRVWVVNYEGDNHVGIAVIKARNPKEVSDILKANSYFNSLRKNIAITRIEEIILDMTTVGLLAEEWI